MHERDSKTSSNLGLKVSNSQFRISCALRLGAKGESGLKFIKEVGKLIENKTQEKR